MSYAWRYTKYGLRIAWGVSGTTFRRRIKDLKADPVFLENNPGFIRDIKYRKLPPRFWRNLVVEYSEPFQAIGNIESECNIIDHKEKQDLFRVLNNESMSALSQIQEGYHLKKYLLK